MNWAQIKTLYESSAGSSHAAGAEAYLHLSEAQRLVSMRIPLQETESIEEELETTESQDYVDIPAELFHVLHVYEKDSGTEIRPEEGGIRGRARFLAPETGMPAEGGPPTNYVPSNGRLYLRPTPDSVGYTIVVRGKRILGDITASSLGDAPALPMQYHMAIAVAAAHLFLIVHPEALKELPEGHLQALEGSLEKSLTVLEVPKDRERFDQRGRYRMRGFRTGMR